MTEEEFRKEIKRICRSKAFKKEYNLKSIAIEFDEEFVGLTIKTKKFTWDVEIDYKVHDHEIKMDSFWYNLSITKSTWETIDDYLGEDFEDGWSECDSLIFTDVQSICGRLLEHIINKFDEEQMITRFKAMDKIIKMIENMDPDDMWVIERVVSRW